MDANPSDLKEMGLSNQENLMKAASCKDCYENLMEALACKALADKLVKEKGILLRENDYWKEKIDIHLNWWQSQKLILESEITEYKIRNRQLTFEATATASRHGWELQEKEKIIQDMGSKLDYKEEESSFLRKLRSRLEEQLKISKKIAEDAVKKKNKATATIKKYEPKLRKIFDGYKARLAAAECERTQAQKEIEALKRKHKEAMEDRSKTEESIKDLKKLREREKTLEAALKKEKAACSALKELEAESERRHSELIQELSLKDREMVVLREEIQNLKVKVEELEGPVNGIDKLGEDSLDAVIEMVTRDNSMEEVFKLKESLAQANQREEELHTAMKDLKKELNEAKQRLKEAEESEEKQAVEMRRMQAPELVKLEEEKWVLTEQVAAIQGQLRQSQEELQALQEKFLLEHLHSDKDDKRGRSKSCLHANVDVDEIERLKADADVKQEEVASLKAELAQVKQSRVEEVEELQRKLGSQQKKLEAALQKRKASSVETLTTENAWLREQLTILESKVQEATKKPGRSMNRNRMEGLTRNLNQELEAAADDEHVKELNLELEMLQKRNARLESELAALKAQVAAQVAAERHGMQEPDYDFMPTQEVSTQPPPQPPSRPPEQLHGDQPGAIDLGEPAQMKASSPEAGSDSFEFPQPPLWPKSTGFSDMSLDSGSGRGEDIRVENPAPDGSKGSSDMDTNTSSDAYDLEKATFPGFRPMSIASGDELLHRKKVADVQQGTRKRHVEMAPVVDVENRGPQSKRSKHNFTTHATDSQRTPLGALSPATNSNADVSSVPVATSGVDPALNNRQAGSNARTDTNRDVEKDTNKDAKCAARDPSEMLRRKVESLMKPMMPPLAKSKERRAPRVTGQIMQSQSQGQVARGNIDEQSAKGASRDGDARRRTSEREGSRKRRSSGMGGYPTPGSADMRVAQHLANRRLSQSSELSGSSLKRGAFHEVFTRLPKLKPGILPADSPL